MADSGPLYLGFDLSTQQLKAIVITSSLSVVSSATVDFSRDLPQYSTIKGVHSNPAAREVYAPVAMWLEAIDLVLSLLQKQKCPFDRIRGISGSGQQHGSVYWSKEGEVKLANLDSEGSLVEGLGDGFAHPWSPNWQDGSTQKECDDFEAAVKGEDILAKITGSRAHHVSILIIPHAHADEV
jgi:xylulokinase